MRILPLNFGLTRNHNRTPPRLLFLIHRLIGGIQQPITTALRLRQFSKSDTQFDPHLLQPKIKAAFIQLLQQFRSQRVPILPFGSMEYENKFVSAQARIIAAVGALAAQQFSHALQYLIAHRVPMLVVYLLEPVYIAQHYAQHFSILHRLLHAAVESLSKRPAVGGPG